MLKKREYPRIGETVYSGQLQNGITVAVIPRPGYKKSVTFLAVNCGGADRSALLDGARRAFPAGTAHFAEHRMFELPDLGDAMTVLSKRGANANAFTGPDMTAFHFECGELFFENLELLLRLVSTPYFTDPDVDREREIIAREIRMTEDDPEDAMYYALLRAMYGGVPMSEPVAGSVESIAGITAETLRDFHRAFYIPANMCLVVAGSQDPERIAAMAAELKGGDVMGRARREAHGRDAGRPLEYRVESEGEIGAPMFLAGAKTAADLRGRESVRFELTAELALGALMGPASPLYRRLYDDGLINETFGYDFENAAGYSHLSFGGETQDPSLVCLKVLDEAAALSSRGLDPDYFARRRRTMYGSCIRALNSFEDVCYNVAAGIFDGYDYFDTLSVLDTVTERDIRAFLAEYLTPERACVSVINRKGR